MTKAVGDAVDRGKKDLDQFMRIQKVNGEISAIETKVSDLRSQVQQIRQEAGAQAINLVRARNLQVPELQVFVQRLASVDQQIAVEEAAISEMKADIDRPALASVRQRLPAVRSACDRGRVLHRVRREARLNSLSQSTCGFRHAARGPDAASRSRSAGLTSRPVT